MKNPEIKNNPDFGEFEVGKSIEWIDEATKNQFSTPAFGYGPGPFEILNLESHGPYFTVEIDTLKGRKKLSSDHFKVKGI